MNAETEDRAEADPSVGSEADERRIIADAIARGSTVTRWTVMIVGLLFIASGLWWAGILVVVVTTFDLPRVATQRYARKRGIRLTVPSAQEVEKTSLTGLLVSAVFLPAVCVLILTEMTLGHPLLPWTWASPIGDDPDLYVVLPLAVCALVITIAWFVRRRRASRRTTHAADSREGLE